MILDKELPSTSGFQPRHNSTVRTPLANFTLTVPTDVNDVLTHPSPTQRILLAVDDRPNTEKKELVIKTKTVTHTNPPPLHTPVVSRRKSIFDPDHSLSPFQAPKTPSKGSTMQNTQNITLANALNRPREPASPRFMAPQPSTPVVAK
ncbi:hypothetical protein ABEB36_015268 [Hypothenemus hampei]|uniref:Uncharacterized protein n=1 Tax=Hypothenemus hampei TaxID=57062 RepID=A0ABD1DZN9_HYPHA